MKQVKDAIQYHDDGSLQVALDKVRARERIGMDIMLSLSWSNNAFIFDGMTCT